MFIDNGLAGRFKDAALFIALPGPSLAQVNPEISRLRGITIMGVNNSWSVIRPHLWTCVDVPSNFCYEGWKDPSILKLIPADRFGDELKRNTPNGFAFTNEHAKDMPNVVQFKRGRSFSVDTYLEEPEASWGCPDKVTDELGITGCRSVMLVAIKLAYVLGFRRVYLMGCDFQGGYAFDQNVAPAMLEAHEHTYKALNARFGALDPLFRQAGFRVYNCTPDSGCDAFEVMDLNDALKREMLDPPETAEYYSNIGKGEKKPKAETLNYEKIYSDLYEQGYHYHSKYCSWALRSLLPWCRDNIDFDSCLDIGCSYGGAVREMQRDGKDSHGIEIARQPVESAEHDRLQVQQASALKIPHDDKSFDLVYSADVFEHLTPSDVPLAITEAVRLSRRYIAIRICPRTDTIRHWRRMARITLHQTIQPVEWWAGQFIARAEQMGRTPKLIMESTTAPEFVIELEA